MDPISAPGTDGSSVRPTVVSGSPIAAAAAAAADAPTAAPAPPAPADDTELPRYTGPDTFWKTAVWGAVVIVRWVVPRGKALHGAAFIAIIVLAVGAAVVAVELAARGTLTTLVHQVHAPGGSVYTYLVPGLGGGGLLWGVPRLLKLRRGTRPAAAVADQTSASVAPLTPAAPPAPEPVAGTVPPTRPAPDVEVQPPRGHVPKRRRRRGRNPGGGNTTATPRD